MFSKPTQPIFGLEYSGPKGGKTTDAVLAFPDAEFIGDPKAILPLFDEYLLPHPVIHDVRTMTDAKTALQAIAKKNKKAAVLDDLSVLADDTIAVLEPKYGTNKLALYGEFRSQLIALRNVARDADMHVWANAHIMPPDAEHGKTGGPKLPGQNSYSISAVVESIVRVEPSPQVLIGWPMVCRIDPRDKAYVTGDRWNAFYDGCPQNTGEILRARGFDIPRAKNMEWQEELVESIANEFQLIPVGQIGAEKKKIYTKWYSEMVAMEIAPPHIYWTIRDGYDRHVIRKFNEKRFKGMLGIG